MHSVLNVSLFALAMAATMISQSAVFEAPAPRSDLRPVAGAENLIDLSQQEGAIIWSSLAGEVAFHSVTGWPSTWGDAELGGGMIMQRPADGMAGVITFPVKPRLVEFALH